MMHKVVYLRTQKKRIALLMQSSAMLGLVFAVAPASAKSLPINDEWSFETTTTLSAGMNWSTEDAIDTLVYKPDANHIGKSGNSIDVNGDDGHVNFSQYDVISQVLKGYTEFRLKGADQGAVLSTKYWYDHAYETGQGDLKEFDDSVWPRLAKFKGIDLWDAYIWKKIAFDNGKTAKLKLGKHVVPWGKSQFFQNGLNSVMAFDYAAFNPPGGDPRERVIPVEQFSFDLGLTKNLKLDGFYQFKFRPSVVDGCGTFFGVSDFVPENCGPIVITVTPGDKLTETALENKIYMPRTESQYAKDGGEYGLSLKQTIPSWNNAELGVYFANYHSKMPNFDGVAVTAPGVANFNTSEYYSLYPEDIKMYGLSLSAKVGDTNLFSELTHKPDQPFQRNGTDVVFALVLDNKTPLTEAGTSVDLGQHLQGWVSLPVTQFSLGASGSKKNIFGANSASWAAEMAVNHVDDIGNHRLGRVGAFGRCELSTGAYDPETKANQCTPYGTAHLSNDEIDRLNERYCNDEGFVTEWSYGYRLRGALTYKDVLPSTVISPSVAFRHDIQGFSQNFQEDQMSVTAAVSATYQQKYTAELGYTNFFGPNEFSIIDDRDFASLAFKANF